MVAKQSIVQIISLCELNGISTGHLYPYIGVLASANEINPVKSWISGKPWDGIDRLQSFYNTLVHKSEYPKSLKETLMLKWVMSAVGAVFKDTGFHCRGVLTLQGNQSIGKTRWVESLVPGDARRASLVKLGHHLDAANKDSQLTAVSHWIVELGELDSSFKKDVARLKGFITETHDKLRRPYAREDSSYPRRTVFCASVNAMNFLVDETGNTRWWTIPVEEVNYSHGIDMQQVFAQVHSIWADGGQWWLTKEEEQLLEKHNASYRTVNVIQELVGAALIEDGEVIGETTRITATELLKRVGIERPTNPQLKDCNNFLRERGFECRKKGGTNYWYVPLKTELTFYQISPRSARTGHITAAQRSPEDF